MFDPKKILILAPHTDDGELGCGGSIAKFCASGKEVYYVAFSTCRQSLPADLPADTLKNECLKATAVLGIQSSNVLFFDLDVRNFPQRRQDILEEMINLNKTIQPDLVLTPSGNDIHQDHSTIHAESLRAFKNCSLLGYELPWNNKNFRTDLFIRLSEKETGKKITALKEYRSQTHRNYMQEEFIRSLAKVRGVQCNSEYAEAFEVYRSIV